MRRILKSFVRRYLRGFGSKDFQDFVGYEVIAHNYVIFSHLLWRLFAKDWLETEFVVDSLLELWALFWGSDAQAGYFGMLSIEERTEVLAEVRQYRADASLIASLYLSIETLNPLTPIVEDIEYDHDYATSAEDHARLFAMRNLLRGLLVTPPFSVNAEALEDCWRSVAEMIGYNPPHPTAIIDRISRFSNYETSENFLNTLCDHYGFSPHSCYFETVKVYRKGVNDSVKVRCLVTNDAKALVDYVSARKSSCGMDAA